MEKQFTRKGWVFSGLIRCVPIVYLSLLAACGQDLQKQQGVLPAAVLSVSGGPVLDFGPVTVDTYVDREITITNIGTLKATELSAALYLSAHFAIAGGTFPGEGGTCTADLQPREHCTVVVRFYPRSTGTLDSFLSLSFFDGNASRNNSELMVRGKGVGAGS